MYTKRVTVCHTNHESGMFGVIYGNRKIGQVFSSSFVFVLHKTLWKTNTVTQSSLMESYKCKYRVARRMHAVYKVLL